MPGPTFQDELAVYGPANRRQPVSVAAAQAYCRQLARSHYENFLVVSLLLPKPLRQHFYNVYAYCRWADDLADETASPAQALDLLAWWEGELERCYAGEASHPVFIALRQTIDDFAIPREPFHDLLIAFRQDQQQTRYATFADLLDYCRYSANPVGELVLYLGKSWWPQTAELSASICTGLQLANHWQDVARDFANGRVYLPQEDMQRYGVTEDDLKIVPATPAFRELLRFEVDRAEEYLRAGEPLCGLISSALRSQVRLFVRGGLAILQEIRKAEYDVLSKRPQVRKSQQIKLLLQCWLTRGSPA